MNISEENMRFSFNFKSTPLYEKWISNFKVWVSDNHKTNNPDGVLELLINLS